MNITNNVKIHPLWYVCLSVRTLLASHPIILNYFYINGYSKYIIDKIKYVIQHLLFIMGCGFLYKYIFGSNDEKQIAKVFWHNTRIVHAILFITAAIYYNYSNITSIILFFDIFFSIGYRSYMQHY